MRVIYADTSALVRAWLPDEPDHAAIRKIVFHDGNFIVTSELARLEFAGAVHAAARDGRIRDGGAVLERFDADCGPQGPLILLALDPVSLFPFAVELLGTYPLRTLDAIHLAAALKEEPFAGGDFALLTQDARQAQAAEQEGLAVL